MYRSRKIIFDAFAVFKMLNCDECDTQLVVSMCSLLLRASLHEVSLIVMQ